MKDLPLAISPCPNDIFLFAPWLKGYVGKELNPRPTFADVEQLNQWAFKKKFPLIKVSMSCLGRLQKDYRLLPVGSALGFGCGPKIIGTSPCHLSEISTKKVAIPGEMTTAHLLFNHFAPTPQEKIFCTYDQISPFLQAKKADLGLIIHETRFTFKKQGFYEIADLGTLWENETALPLPLGGLGILRDLPLSIDSLLINILQKSYDFAKKFPEKIYDDILFHSQEKDLHVVNEHIALYVNEETRALSPLGFKAIETLWCYDKKTHPVCPSRRS